MKLFLLIVLCTLLLFLLACHLRRKRIIRKIRSMSSESKEILLNDLVAPFGFCYVPGQDIFSTHSDAWQRDFGYTSAYDKSAVHFHMIFDNLPIYFNYQNKTWLLEVWKGQYGISTGCEIGLYYADRLLAPQEYSSALFSSVTDSDMIKMSFMLCKDEIPIAKLLEKHWWLTAFLLGKFSWPYQLSTLVTLNFPTSEMAKAYADQLRLTNVPLQNVYRHCNTVGFLFSQVPQASGFFLRLRTGLAQLSNRFWCGVYNFITRPFILSLDKTLYLYYRIPFIFRKIFKIRRYRKHDKRK